MRLLCKLISLLIELWYEFGEWLLCSIYSVCEVVYAHLKDKDN